MTEVAMGRERLEQIRKKNWERDARAARNEVRATLEQPLRIELVEFLTKEESERYGAQFWERLRSVDNEFDVGFGEVARLVTRSTPYPEPTVWLHGRTQETGAILIPSREMWRAGSRNWEQLGPDLIFGAQDLTSGLCFEVQENEERAAVLGVDVGRSGRGASAQVAVAEVVRNVATRRRHQS